MARVVALCQTPSTIIYVNVSVKLIETPQLMKLPSSKLKLVLKLPKGV